MKVLIASFAAEDRFFDLARRRRWLGTPSRSSHLLEERRKLMERRLHVGLGDDAFHNLGDGWDPNDLLHPAQAFEHPSHVVNDPDLTLNEKRAILASWASDACAPEAAPHLRRAPGGKQPVLFDEVMEALRTLDKQASEQGRDSARYRRLLRRSRFERRSRSPSGEDHSLN
jgi:hypothetical protein